MKIIIARNAGFCPGVNNAINRAIELREKSNKDVYTLGPLIHNKEVINSLINKGIRVVEDVDEIKDKKNSILVIRAHGIPWEVEEKIRKSGIEFVDATCPLVKKVHNIIKQYREKGYYTIIVGDREHAEVIGLKGYAGEKSFVISSKEEADKIPWLEKANIVSQTTQEEDFFYEIVKIVQKKVKELVVSNTICQPTRARQKETIELSKIADLVIVIGGRHSANTQRLYQICNKLSKNSILIENENELDYNIIKNKENIFITAGASTPLWLIERVEKKLKELSRKENLLVKLFKFMIISGIFSGFYAIGILRFIDKITGLNPPLSLEISIALAIICVHIINRTIETRSIEDFRSILIFKYSTLIRYLSIFFFLSSLILAVNTGILYLALISIFLIPGFFYSKLRNKIKIPAAKDIFVSSGWTYAISFIPSYPSSIRFDIILFTFIISTIRNLILSTIHKSQDVIATPQTLTYYLKIHEVYKLIYILLFLLLLISLKYVKLEKSIIILPVYYLFLLIVLKKKKIGDPVFAEFLTELPFVIMFF